MYSIEYEYREASSRVEMMRSLAEGAPLDDPNKEIARQVYNIRAQAHRYLQMVRQLETNIQMATDEAEREKYRKEKQNQEAKVLLRCLRIYRALVLFTGVDPEPTGHQSERDGIFDWDDEE